MAYNPNNPNGSATSANSAPVVIASDQATVPVSLASVPSHAVTNAGTFAVQATGTVTANAGTGTMAVSAAALPLPTGASTAAKQPALGTAGTPSADVLTVQGATSMTALKTDGSGVTQPISAAALPLPTGASTSALQTTGNTSVASIDTKTPALGQALAAASVPVVLPAAQITTLTPLSTVTANIGTSGSLALDATLTGGTQKTKLVDTAGTNVATISAAGALKVDNSAVTQPVSGTFWQATQPVSIATMPSTPVTGTFWQATQPVSGTVTANAGTGTMAVSLASLPALATGANVIGSLTANQSVNNAQVNGVTVSTDNGASGTGVQRVTIANNSTGTVGLNAGSNLVGKVGIDQTTPGTTNAVTQVPATTGGLSTYHLVSAATTNATNIKASAGQVFGWTIYNSNAAMRKVVLHNTAGTPTAGAAVFYTIPIPPGAMANVHFNNGIAFSTGIGITTVTGLADSDATAVALNDLAINIFYK